MKELVIGQRTLSVSDEGQGRPLLLVHGFPLDHSMWSEQIAELQSDCRIIAPDLFGFGNSQPVDAEDEKLTMSQMADDLAEILSRLEISEPVYYCGLSMGGYVGWQFYRRHKEQLRGLIM